MAEAKFDVLATNIVDGNGLPANTKADKMIEVQGVKIGLFGLTTEDTRYGPEAWRPRSGMLAPPSRPPSTPKAATKVSA
ncbi:hypothetical protein [Microvirga arabica]|uniref:hypothetical protein n=1 Tax=Microvirga arabica TaxID=1128671 RepID=UPI003611A565